MSEGDRFFAAAYIYYLGMEILDGYKKGARTCPRPLCVLTNHFISSASLGVMASAQIW